MKKRVAKNQIDPENKKHHWHSLDINSIFSELKCNLEGLSEEESKIRVDSYGKNLIIKKTNDSPIKILWRQINNPLIWVLIGSSLAATLVGKITDGLVVLSVVIINSVIGFIQEYKAGKAIRSLSELVPEITQVLRNGIITSIQSSDLVPGDIVVIHAGERIAADMRLISQKNLTVAEAALTGESIPVQKNLNSVEKEALLGYRKCMIYNGTLVTSGSCKAIVVETGMRTELGKISHMLNETTNLATPLTKKLNKVSQLLTLCIIVITIAIMIAGTFRALDAGVILNIALKDSLVFAIALAVGAIPEGLPAVVTIALAVGVRNMAKRKAIIRHLPAVETLGSTSVICTDKTGTLTKNEMTVCNIWTISENVSVSGTGYSLEGTFISDGKNLDKIPEGIQMLLKNAALCCDAAIKHNGSTNEIIGDPTEGAILIAAKKAGIDLSRIHTDSPRIDVLPFDSEMQFMATLIGTKEKTLIIKGAPEVILKRSNSLFGSNKMETLRILNQIELFGARGIRVLAVAFKPIAASNQEVIMENEISGGFAFQGLIGMIDPPRLETRNAIKICQEAGIIIKMITGDHKATARSIGMDLGLSPFGEAINGNELMQMNQSELSEAVSSVNIFSRVAPEHKLKLVNALQNKSMVVAMTGDGVNDAPALKQANIGIAMGITGTSVSKESADIVLQDDNFSSISAAVEEGRRVYDNLIKSLAFLLPTNLGLALILVYGILFFPFNPLTMELLLPLLPTQLLWINLVAAITLALPLAFEVSELNIMKRPPRDPQEPLFSSLLIFRIFSVSILMTVGTIILFNTTYYNALKDGVQAQMALPIAQTQAVTFIILFQIFYMISCRSINNTVFQIGLFKNKVIYIGIFIILALQILFIYTPTMQKIFNTSPLSLEQFTLALMAAIIIAPIILIEKFIRFLTTRNSK